MPKRGSSRVNLSSVLSAAGETASAESAVARQLASDGSSQRFVEVPINAIAANIRNVRQKMRKIDELAASIAEVGVLEPVVLRPISQDEQSQYPPRTMYVLVMGERRFLASKKAGRSTMPAIVRIHESATHEHKLMMLENLHREDLDPIEEAHGYRYLLEEAPAEERMGQRALAGEFGKTQAHISRRLALLQLDEGLQQLVAGGTIGVNVAYNHLRSLELADQAAVAAHVQASLGDDPEEEWEPSKLRQLAQDLAHERQVEAVRADQRATAERVGARICESVDDLPDPVRADLAAHRVHDEAAAAALAEVFALITDYRTGPEWYSGDSAGITFAALSAQLDRAADVEEDAPSADTADPAAGESTITPAPDVDDDRSVHQAGGGVLAGGRNTEVMAEWAREHRRVKRPELEEIARWLAERIPDDEPAALVRNWLQVDGTWAEWKQDLRDDPFADSVLRAAYLYTVAEDLVKARDDPNSPAGRRTSARIIEQEGEDHD